MRKSPFKFVSPLEIVQQMQGKKIAQTKFPFISENTQIIYPPHVNLEQASSQATAQFKQKIMSGEKGVDLTGGMGIDSFFISESSKEFFYVEPDLELLEIVTHNFSVLNKKNITFINKTAEEFLAENSTHFDFIYLDPSRRDKNNNKVILLKDLKPDVTLIQEKLLQASSSVFIKLSPLLDLQQVIDNLSVSTIFIVSVKNEAKELIVKLNPDQKPDQKNTQENLPIRCFNLETNQPEFSFYWSEEKQAKNPDYSLPESYLHIPNASILKSGAFKLISHRYNLKKLHPNTHIYTSHEIVPNFPGKVFFILDPHFIPAKSEQDKFNIISKNHPLKTAAIRKRYGLDEGGEDYLIFTRSMDKNLCILAELIE
jgi:16S rRNA G966 N2-methylase RsmD